MKIRKTVLSALVAVVVFGAFAADVGVSVNGMDVSAGEGAGWTFADKVLTLSGPGPYVLSGTNGQGEVHVSQEASATVVLSNLVLQTSLAGYPAYSVGRGETEGDSPDAVRAEIFLFGTNLLTSSSGSSDKFLRQGGISVWRGSSVRIDKAKGLTNEEAYLHVEGRMGSAGIGGCHGYSTGRIVVSGGTIYAQGGSGAAGIGGGDYAGKGGEVAGWVEIEGGFVEAAAGDGARAIGAGCAACLGEGYDIRINAGTVNALKGQIAAEPAPALGTLPRVTGGSVNGLVLTSQGEDGELLWRVMVRELGEAPVTVTGLPSGYGTKDIVPINGYIYLWLPNGMYNFAVDGKPYVARVADKQTEARRALGVSVNGDDLSFAFGEGWDYIGSRLTLSDPGLYVLSGTNLNGDVEVRQEASATVVLSNLVLQTSLSGFPVYSVGRKETEETSSLAVQAEIRLVGTNRLVNTSTNSRDFLRSGGISVWRGSSVRIDKAVGLTNAEAYLWAEGGAGSAGIGGGVKCSTGRISISGGTICAKGGSKAAGIGGGDYAGSDDEVAGWVEIEGGVVEAIGGDGARGIGAGCAITSGEGYDISIQGGTVRATEGGIASLSTDDGYPVLVTGGNVCGPVDNPQDEDDNRLWRVTVPGLGEGPATITGLPGGYGTKDIVPIDGSVYLWLPNGTYDFTVNGRRMIATVVNSNTVAIEYVAPFPKAVYTVGNKTLTFRYDAESYPEEKGSVLVWTNLADSAWTGEIGSAVEKVALDDSFAAYRPTTTRRWFAQLGKVQNLDLTILDLSAATDVREMFAGSASLQRIFVSDRISITNCTTAMTVDMFSGCESLAGEFGTSYATLKPIPSDAHRLYAQPDGEDFYGTGEQGLFSRQRQDVRLTVPTELPANVASVAVYENGILVGDVGKVYVTKVGYAMSVVYTVAEGFQFPDGTTSYEFMYPVMTGNVEVDVSKLPPRRVKPPRPIGVVAGTKLTLYFDNLNHLSDGDETYVDETWGGWIPSPGATAESPIREIVFDPGFAEARLMTTKSLFQGLGNVTNIAGLCHLDTSSVTDMDAMFCGMGSLRTLTVGDRFVTNAVVRSHEMFEGCTNLMGQFGTALAACPDVTDARLACVDFGADRPGLFTAEVPYEALVREPDGSLAFFHTLDAALSDVTTGAVVKVLAERTAPVAFDAGIDFVFDANGKVVEGLSATIREAVTLTFKNAPAGTLAALAEPGSRVAFDGELPQEDVFLSVSYPERRAGELVVTNTWGVLPAAERVRVCQAGVAVFPAADGLTLEMVWSRPFVRVEAAAGITNFTAFASADEAVGASAVATLGLLDYVNDALPFETNVVVSSLAVDAGKAVALTTVLRQSADGTNTAWRIAEAPRAATLRGDVRVDGALGLRNVRIDGAIVLGTNAVLDIAADYALADGYVYLTLEDPTRSTTLRIVSERWTPAELKAHCRVTNPGWTFVPGTDGLVVKKVDDYVARVGGVYYESVDAALAAVTNGGSVAFLSYTNTVTETHTDVVAAQTNRLEFAAGKQVTFKSARRTTVEGSRYFWDDDPAVPTTLDLDGVTLELGAGAELVLSNVVFAGTVDLKGAGLLDVRGNSAAAPIRVRLGSPSTSVERVIARGRAAQFELTGSAGSLVEREGFVVWSVDVFSWSYLQTGNGKVTLTINDGGSVREREIDECTGGTFSYAYTREGGKGTVTLTGYVVYLDYDTCVLHLPDVEVKYLRQDDAWQGIRNGDEFPIDWKVDSDGALTFRFAGETRKVYGIASRPATPEERNAEFEQKVKAESEKRKRDQTHIGGLFGALAGGATITGVFGGAAALVTMGGGGGAVVPAVAGANAIAAAIEAEVEHVVGGPNQEGEIPRDDLAADPHEHIDPDLHVDPEVRAEWAEKLDTLWGYLGNAMDVYTVARAALDVLEAFLTPIEYKGWPSFASRFQSVHGSAAKDNNAQYQIHWFFSTTVHSSKMPTNGEVDITAAMSFKDFAFAEIGVGGFDEKSGYGSFKDSMTILGRAVTVIDAIRGKLSRQSKGFAILGECATLFRNALNKLNARGYFDPPANASIVLPASARYNVNSMEFGTKSRWPNSPRTAPIFEVQSGSRLRLADCSMSRYRFNTAKGLVHVASGATLILNNFKLSDNQSDTGSSPIVVEPGGKVIVTGSTSLSGISCGPGDLSIETGDYRSTKSAAGKLTGEVYIDGRIVAGDPLCANAMTNAVGWEHVHSQRYGRWIAPSADGTHVLWAYRPGAVEDLTPKFDPLDPLAIGVSGGSAYIDGTITNAYTGFAYDLIRSSKVDGGYQPLPSRTVEPQANGRMSIQYVVPAADSSGFFRIRVVPAP